MLPTFTLFHEDIGRFKKKIFTADIVSQYYAIIALFMKKKLEMQAILNSFFYCGTKTVSLCYEWLILKCHVLIVQALRGIPFD